jgi:ABC-type multidrug transport system ATPase subunit
MLAHLAGLNDVTKVYRAPGWRGERLVALSRVSLSIGSGEVVALRGPNRSGKSTILRLLLGLSRPTSGTVWRFGQPASVSATLARVGYVPERPAFLADRSPSAILRLLGTLSGLSSAAVTARVDRAVAEAGLGAVADRASGTLSRGTLQRLAIAQALLHDPELLLLDEPFAGLDPEGVSWLSGRIGTWAEAGRAVMVVTHSPALAGRLATRQVVLDAGRVRFDGPSADADEGDQGVTDEAMAAEVLA